MKIKDYGQFLIENIENPNDINNILDLIKNASMKDILELRDSIEELSMKSEKLNENFVTDFIDKLKIKFRKIFDDKLWKYLINRKQKFYFDLVEKKIGRASCRERV